MGTYVFAINIVFSARREPFEYLLRLILAELGIADNEIVTSLDGKERGISVFMGTAKKAESLKNRLEGLRLKGVTIDLKILRDSDWKTKWKDNTEPFMVTEKLRVAPFSYRDKFKNSKDRTVFIDTDIVFGYGTHATTRAVAGFMENKRGLFETFLDIGTGTGILSIIARKCGAKEVWALDISASAVKTAGKNLAENGYRADYLEVLDFSKFSDDKTFDFVAANLLSEDLICMRDKIISCVRTGKYLAVSGIFAENYGSFRRRFDAGNIKCLRIKKEDGWYSVLYRVKSRAVRRPLPRGRGKNFPAK
ncbi:MAG: 50S ribosomal protein L11 methyltransferase [Candidatus Omnitrophota bacterium]